MNIKSLFSITNHGVFRIINIFGIKLKINCVKIKAEDLHKIPLQNNKIVFCNMLGGGYGCNPKYIAEEILKRHLAYDLVWLTNDVKQPFPPQIRAVKYNSKQAMQELASAKIWVDNNRKIAFLHSGLFKRDKQFYIQTWHGSLGIKKIDADIVSTDAKWAFWKKWAKIDSDCTDYLLVNSEFEHQVLVPAYLFDNEIKTYGHPRNDVFFYDNCELIAKVKKAYNIDVSAKICLYAPSFRDNRRTDGYNIDYDTLKRALEQKFGGNWVIITRLHPIMNEHQDIIPQQDYIINATNYPDIQELLVASDVVVTDYSSCVFDFMLSRKPAFIFATDIKEYDTERGLYYPLTATPFPVAENNAQLMKNIIDFDDAKYQNAVERFLTEKGCMEDGHAAGRVVDLIENIMKGSK